MRFRKTTNTVKKRDEQGTFWRGLDDKLRTSMAVTRLAGSRLAK